MNESYHHRAFYTTAHMLGIPKLPSNRTLTELDRTPFHGLYQRSNSYYCIKKLDSYVLNETQNFRLFAVGTLANPCAPLRSMVIYLHFLHATELAYIVRLLYNAIGYGRVEDTRIGQVVRAVLFNKEFGGLDNADHEPPKELAAYDNVFRIHDRFACVPICLSQFCANCVLAKKGLRPHGSKVCPTILKAHRDIGGGVNSQVERSITRTLSVGGTRLLGLEIRSRDSTKDQAWVTVPDTEVGFPLYDGSMPGGQLASVVMTKDER